MHYVLALCLIALLLYWRFGKKIFALFLIGLAVLTALRGMLLISLLLAVAGFFAGGGKLTSEPASRSRAPKRNSHTRGASNTPTLYSRYLTLYLDAETGRITGTPTAGPNIGNPLAQLDQPALQILKTHYEAGDRESAAFLYAYLDQAFPAWRKAERGAAKSEREGAIAAKPMTEADALEALGLAGKPEEEEIKKAHRSLMKKFHPDQGGSEIIAAKINMAKDTLL